MDVQKELLSQKESKLKKYQRLIIGSYEYAALIRYELTMLFTGWVPGALGLLLRSILYPYLLKKCGRNVSFGTNIVWRHPGKIVIGDNVVIDDNCVIDAKGIENSGIVINSDVFIGRNTIIYCQDGDINIGKRANIGSNCQIFSAKSVVIGQNVLMGAYTYIIGGGHRHDRFDIPIIEQGRHAKQIIIEDNTWLGAGVKVLDGVKIGKDAIIGTGAVVKKDIPAHAIAAGVPAKIIGDQLAEKI